MYIDKMTEYICLEFIMRNRDRFSSRNEGEKILNNLVKKRLGNDKFEIDFRALINRKNDLIAEILEPYVIESKSND